jgi:hypothetical protein
MSYQTHPITYWKDTRCKNCQHSKRCPKTLTAILICDRTSFFGHSGEIDR